MTEERIARLEETLYFQERLLADLNNEVTLLHKSTDALTRRMDGLAREVAELRDVLFAEKQQTQKGPDVAFRDMPTWK